MSRPFYLKTSWDFTVRSSFNANSLMDRTLYFVGERYVESNHPLTGWIFLVGAVGTWIISQSWSETSCKTWIPRSFSGLDHCDDCDFFFVFFVFCFGWTQSNTKHCHLIVSILHGQTDASLDSHISACVPWFRITNEVGFVSNHFFSQSHNL